MSASADCAFLGERTHVVRDGGLVVGPPPPGPVASCARGLSRPEKAFTEVFLAGATVRRTDDRLVIDHGGRTVALVRSARSGADVELGLLAPDRAGDAASLSGVLEVDGPCLYVRTPYGDRILPALKTPGTWWDDASGVLHVGEKAFVPGSRVRLGGSFLKGPAPLRWRQSPNPVCDRSRTWITVSVDPDPEPKVVAYSADELARLRAADAAK